MKKTIISTIALASVAFGVVAQDQNQKNVVITDKDGVKTEFAGSNVDGIIFQETPAYINLPKFNIGTYEETGAVGKYTVEFGTDEPDDKGYPLNIGDMLVVLELTGAWSDVVTDPKLPAGYYRIGNGTQTNTFNVNKSAVWIRVEDSDEGVSPLMIIDGTVDVRTDDNKHYDIRMEFTTMSGPLDFQYEGEIAFSAGASEFKPFTEDVNIEFQGAQGRFYSNWYYPFASDLSALFYKGTVEDGVLKDGYRLDISFYEPKSTDESNKEQRIADGTYTVESREAIKNTFLPYRYEPGKWIDVMGQEYLGGTRLEYYAPDGSRKLGMIKGGSFTVSENGTKFVFDLVTEEGIKVTGSYNRAPILENYCDNETNAPKRPYSTLTEDHTMTWLPETVAISYNDGNSILDDTNTLVVMIGEPNFEKGEYLQFEVLSKNPVLSDGVYQMNMSLQPETLLPGVIDYARYPQFSWYGDLDHVDPDGVQENVACLASGTVTITSGEGGSKHFVFDLVDDAGYKVTGVFDGPIIDITPDANAAKRLRKAKAHTKPFAIKRNK